MVTSVGCGCGGVPDRRGVLIVVGPLNLSIPLPLPLIARRSRAKMWSLAVVVVPNVLAVAHALPA